MIVTPVVSFFIGLILGGLIFFSGMVWEIYLSNKIEKQWKRGKNQ